MRSITVFRCLTEAAAGVSRERRFAHPSAYNRQVSERDYEFELDDDSDRSFVAALLLCFFFGVLGFHRFYVGKIGTGILLLISCGGLGVWWIVDFVLIATSHFKDKDGFLLRP